MTAGNNGSRSSNTVTWPAKHDNVISVGGCTEYGKRMEMSAVGREIDFLCPGQNIISTSKIIIKNLQQQAGLFNHLLRSV